MVAATTGRILMGLRSPLVTRPMTWAPFGGHREPGETLEETVIRELYEETRYRGPIKLKKIGSQAFIGVVPDEFPPVLNWEHIGSKWVKQ